jgi:hypothetical protein
LTFDNDRARELWAKTQIRVWPESVVLVSLPVERAAEAASLAGRASPGFVALMVERDEVSLTVPETLWRSEPLRHDASAEAGPFRVITFDLDLDLEVCGYLAPAAVALASAGVPIVPQCAYRTDHLLVASEKLDAAVAALDALVAQARATG